MSRTRDGFSGFNFFQALNAQAAAATATGVDVDRQGYDSLAFVVNLGRCSHVSTLSYWKLRIQHTDASALGAGPSDYADVDASTDLLREASGALTSGIFQNVTTQVAASTSVQGSVMHFVGYVGTKRYVRVVAEMVSTPSVLDIAVNALLGKPGIWPVNTPNRG